MLRRTCHGRCYGGLEYITGKEDDFSSSYIVEDANGPVALVDMSDSLYQGIVLKLFTMWNPFAKGIVLAGHFYQQRGIIDVYCCDASVLVLPVTSRCVTTFGVAPKNLCSRWSTWMQLPSTFRER